VIFNLEKNNENYRLFISLFGWFGFSQRRCMNPYTESVFPNKYRATIDPASPSNELFLLLIYNIFFPLVFPKRTLCPF